MDSAGYSNKAHGTNMRVTRLAAKEAARAIGQKEKPTKRKRHRENETPATAANGSKDQNEDRETDEETTPDKIRKVCGEAEETNDSEEDMEVKEDEEDEDGDQDQDMTEGVDEEDSGCHVQDRQMKTSSGEPLAVDRNVFRPSAYTDANIANCLRSRRSIHLESPGKEVHSHGTAEPLSGISLRSRENRTETLPPRARITQYSEEIVFTKPKLVSQNRYPPPQAKVTITSRPYVTRNVYPANSVPLHRPTPKGQKQELPVKSTVKTASYSFCAGWFWKLFLLALLSAGAIPLYLFAGKRASERQSVAEADKVFQARFLEMESSFPSQRAELWKRSRIHLERHLQTAEPTEPVSMILTSGRGAERTLHCLAGRMAAAFSTALGASGASGASVLHVDGAAAAALESDRVKLDIDQRLSGAFEGDGRAAVVHRFEELPPGSTLIFYKYCDHENAAYKKVLLVFTVLLEEDELGPQLALNAVEEMVQERIQDKLLSPDQPASFDRMDMDKLSGLWSRISHLILPVAAEERVEREGCES
ncbi:torsin-1A-interacting protein 2-like isoform X12 [Anguilla anguilla]|uniref:torsin-1A-interacting protein 2-like isoform X12 n=1 Tax=Anguilla anguilla TaxID=7936 RepID=UPI0015AC2E03|nr:torsin-1A-interacting protein 2-like isoform X12 [Anguilla anguilla]